MLLTEELECLVGGDAGEFVFAGRITFVVENRSDLHGAHDVLF